MSKAQAVYCVKSAEGYQYYVLAPSMSAVAAHFGSRAIEIKLFDRNAIQIDEEGKISK